MGARYVALEGAEGCGKSTQARRLADSLGAVLTRETGGTGIGTRLRTILHDPATMGLDPVAEALIIAADRAQHMAEVVGPALDAGRHVVSDRSVHSSVAYQGYGRGLPLDAVRAVNDWALRGRWPDLVVLLDVPEGTLRARMASRDLDRFEQEHDAFHERVRAGFVHMAAADPARWVVVPGDLPEDEVARQVRAAVRKRLGV